MTFFYVFETGVSHSDELALLFPIRYVSDVPKDSRDYQMSLDLVKLWVSFAKQKNGYAYKNVPSKILYLY